MHRGCSLLEEAGGLQNSLQPKRKAQALGHMATLAMLALVAVLELLWVDLLWVQLLWVQLLWVELLALG